MGAKSDHRRSFAEFLPTKLTDVEFAADRAHVGKASVADMGIMRPNHGLGLGPVSFEDMAQGLEHVRITQIPGLGTAIVHDPVVALG